MPDIGTSGGCGVIESPPFPYLPYYAARRYSISAADLEKPAHPVVNRSRNLYRTAAARANQNVVDN